MSLSVIPLTILGQITGVTGSGETALYQVSFKSIDGTPLYGVTAVWTDEQAEIEALAAQKPYGIWINPIDGTFTVKFAGYTYKGSADLTDPDVLAGITPIEFNNEAAGGGGSSAKIIHAHIITESELTGELSFGSPNAIEVDNGILVTGVSTRNILGGADFDISVISVDDYGYFAFPPRDASSYVFEITAGGDKAELTTLDYMVGGSTISIPVLKFEDGADIEITITSK